MTALANPNYTAHIATPNYLRRRIGAATLGVIALAAVYATGATAKYQVERFTATDVPSTEDIAANPAAYVPYTVQKDENLSIIADRYTPEGHLVSNNAGQLATQIAGQEMLQAGDVLMVPPQTIPVDQREGFQSADTPDGS